MGYFEVRYDYRVVNYDRRCFIRLATGLSRIAVVWKRIKVFFNPITGLSDSSSIFVTKSWNSPIKTLQRKFCATLFFKHFDWLIFFRVQSKSVKFMLKNLHWTGPWVQNSPASLHLFRPSVSRAEQLASGSTRRRRTSLPTRSSSWFCKRRRRCCCCCCRWNDRNVTWNLEEVLQI